MAYRCVDRNSTFLAISFLKELGTLHIAFSSIVALRRSSAHAADADNPLELPTRDSLRYNVLCNIRLYALVEYKVVPRISGRVLGPVRSPRFYSKC